MDPARALSKQKKTGHGELVLHVETWIDHADEVLVEAQTEERIVEQRLGEHATKTYPRSLVETALEKRSKSRPWVDNPDYHICAPHGQPQQHHAAAEHAGTHEGMEQQVELGHGGTLHPTATHAISQPTSTFYFATHLDSGILAPYFVKHGRKPCQRCRWVDAERNVALVEESNRRLAKVMQAMESLSRSPTQIGVNVVALLS